MSNLKYKNKYLKYKNKYLDLKSQIGGSPPSNTDNVPSTTVEETKFLNLPEDLQKQILTQVGYVPIFDKTIGSLIREQTLKSLKDKLRLNKSVTKQDMFISVHIHVYHPEYLSNEEILILAKIFIENIEHIMKPRIQYMLSLYIPEFVALHHLHLNTPLVFNLENLKIFILGQGSLEPLRLRFDNTHHTFDNQLHFELLFIFLCILLRQIKFPLLEIEFNAIQLQIFKRSFLKIIFGLNNNIIKKLIFKYGNITDSEVVELANALTTNTSLTTLNLSGDIKDEGAKALANALIENKTLQTLHFYYRRTYPTDEGALALAAALKQNTTLTTLDLGYNSIGDEGAKALANALAKNETLTNINLRSNIISNIGANALADALKNNRTLTKLNIDSPSFIDAEIKTKIKNKLAINATT